MATAHDSTHVVFYPLLQSKLLYSFL